MKTATDIKVFQTVSIWWGERGFSVRGYYRGVSYFIEKFDSLDSAVECAFATNRKQRSVALVPIKEEFEEFARKAVEALIGGAA